MFKVTETDAIGIDVGNVISAGGNEIFTPDFLKSKFMPDAIECISWLSNIFGPENMFIVSKCGEAMQIKTMKWLIHNEFFRESYVLPENVHFCLKRDQKAGICRKLGITYFIDDRIDIVEHVAQNYNPAMKAVFHFKPGDERIKYSAGNIIRVKSWLDVISHFGY